MRISKYNRSTIVSTFLNILGMAVAFAAMYVILVQVKHDFTYNKSIPDHDRIYQLTFKNSGSETLNGWLPRPCPEAAKNTVAGIEACGTINLAGMDALMYVEEGKPLKTKVSELSEDALDVFSIEFLQGKFDDLVGRDVAVTESLAEAYALETGSVIKLSVNQSAPFEAVVKAVLKDAPVNSDLSTIGIYANLGERSMDDNEEWSYMYYAKLTEGQDAAVVEKSFSRPVFEFYSSLYGDALGYSTVEEFNEIMSIHLEPLDDVYFNQNMSPGCTGAQGNKSTTMMLLLVAVLVIGISLINYVNFFFSLIPLRIRSVNTRKILGSSRAALIRIFMLESLLNICVSLILAFALVVLFTRSSWSELIGAELSLTANLPILFTVLFIAVAAGLVTSIYPARYITSFSPAMVIKGSFAATGKGKVLRTGLVGLQFVISMSLVICSLFIKLQRDYMMDYDMGFDRENLYVTTIPGEAAHRSARAITDKLMSNSAVKDVTWSNGDIVAEYRMGWGRDFKGENINFQCYPVDWNFLNFMGIDIVEGRDFTEADMLSETGVFIFNEKARDAFELTLEDRIHGHISETEIAGFCKDFNFKGLQNGVEPFAFYIFGKSSWKVNNTLYVRTETGTGIKNALDLIHDTIRSVDESVTDDLFDVKLYDSRLMEEYEREAKLSRLIVLFTIIAIIISLMGVFGMVMFETEYRRKEIGVRRVNGASVKQILLMFNKKFIAIVLVSFAVAVPFCVLIMSRYLSGFAYRVPMHIWVFAIALMLVFIVTALVVTVRSWGAATVNPTESLKAE